MVIKQPNPRYFTFRLEGKEWKVENGKAVRQFLDELKLGIPSEARDFDSSTNTWTVEGCYFEKVFRPLKEKYFIDERQSELFA
jgi:hypothetical protein